MLTLPIALGLIEFAAEFVHVARKNTFEAPGVNAAIFTSRQALAMSKLGVCSLLRNVAPLDIPDLVKLAVVTSPPKAKKYAEMIALRILLDETDPADLLFLDENQVISQEPDVKIRNELSKSAQLLHNILEFIDVNQSVDLDQSIDQLKFINSIEQEIFGLDPNEFELFEFADKLKFMRKRIAFDLVGGRSAIIQEKMEDWFEIFDTCRRKILQAIPMMENEGIVNGFLLGWIPEMKKFASESSMVNFLHLLDVAGYWDEQKVARDVPFLDSKGLETIFEPLTHRELVQTVELLRTSEDQLLRFGVDPSTYSPNLSRLINEIEQHFLHNAAIFDDVLTFPDLFEEAMERDLIDSLIANSKEYYQPMDLLKKAHELDDILHSNISERLYNERRELFDDLLLEDLLESEIPNFEWMDMVQEKFANLKEDEELSFMDHSIVRDNLFEQLEGSKNETMQDLYKQMLQTSTDLMINLSESGENLENAVEKARSNKIPVNGNQIRSKGQDLGLDEKEIAKLLGSLYEYLKDLIEVDDPTFFEVNRLLEQGNLAPQETQNLIGIAIKEKKVDALGAFCQTSLLETMAQIPNSQEGQDMLTQALGAGGGENLLYQWFRLQHRIPHSFRQIIKDHVKRIIIEIAKSRSASLIGSSDAGPLPEGSIRPFMLGDDLDTIDLEETIENLLDSGKGLSTISYDDFIVKKEISGRRCVVFLVDISGSMAGEPLGSASIVTAMLLMAFSRDELGVALFESNTHILCDISKKIELDEVVDEILELKARGGTQMREAIQWANTQFKMSTSVDKIFIMLTDAMLGDFHQSQQALQHLTDQGARSVLIVPNNLRGMGNVQQIIRAANCEVIQVKDWRRFPEIVSKVLSTK